MGTFKSGGINDALHGRGSIKMTEDKPMRIIVHPNGPYRVLGGVPLAVQTITPNQEGESWDWVQGRSFHVGPEYFLCRCGRSSNKPFCDNSHLSAGFVGAETASRRPIERQSEHLDGPTHVLSDAEGLCAFARFCDPGGKIWALIGQTDQPEVRKLVVREASHCPAGRLVLREKATGKVVEPELPPSIGLVEDPALHCSGPLWVRGGIPVESSNGVPYEVRNRLTLCRCGVSTNMPFCNGSHASIRFQDGLV
ncbi:MAG: CDGSH iron-sulfur domain-containing protein [Thermoplasmata archaeon]|nr:CDGSH iron-sulfur domain-containing protein [Thermoplasmata archaeon]MCI4359514.1 CDGSH iron-sulfur domain-containing protein [Thermoplasmata archaeon]